MAASSINRETMRDALATLLNSALVGTGKPADKVFGYLAGDFGTPVSVVVVTSAGSERQRAFHYSTPMVDWFYLDIFVYVLYNDGAAWTEAQAEDQRDLIEKTISDTIQDNEITTNWRELQYDGRTTATEVQIEGGQTYFVERIPVKCQALEG